MTPEGSAPERLLDLAIKRALEGLDLDEARELAALSHLHPDVELDDIDQVIALLDSVRFGNEPPLPATVASAVEQRLAPVFTPPPMAARPSRWPWLALAASLIFAAAGWYQALRAPTASEQAQTRAAPVVAPSTAASTAPPSVRERVDADRDALSLAWTDPTNSDRVRGAVHWSARHQLGYMEFEGLDVNDPAVAQYQLWIFDNARPEAYPVDGGVFDIRSPGPSVVPVRATLPVTRATLFAVTVEAPGGVMVSSREQIVALAQVPGS